MTDIDPGQKSDLVVDGMIHANKIEATEIKPPYRYERDNMIVQDGDENEPLKVKLPVAIQGEEGHRLGYVCERVSDGELLYVSEDRASDYVQLR